MPLTAGKISQRLWTPIYHGITHFGELQDKFRLTVTDRGTFVELDMWFPGCSFTPLEKECSSVEEAKQAGLDWLKSQTGEVFT